MLTRPQIVMKTAVFVVTSTRVRLQYRTNEHRILIAVGNKLRTGSCLIGVVNKMNTGLIALLTN